MNPELIQKTPLEALFALDVFPYTMVAICDRMAELTGEDCCVVWNPANTTTNTSLSVITHRQSRALQLHSSYVLVYLSGDPGYLWIAGEYRPIHLIQPIIDEFPLSWHIISQEYQKRRSPKQ